MDAYDEFKDAGAHLSKAAWHFARDLVSQGYGPLIAIEEAEKFDYKLNVLAAWEGINFDEFKNANEKSA